MLVWQKIKCVYWACTFPIPPTTSSSRSLSRNPPTFTWLLTVSSSTLIFPPIPCKFSLSHCHPSIFITLSLSLSYCCCQLAHRGGRINVDNLIAGVDWSTQKAIELPEFKVTTSYPPQSPFIKKRYSIPCVVSWIDTYSTLSRRPFSHHKPTGGVLGLQVIYSNVYCIIPLN